MEPERALHIIEEMQSLSHQYASYGRQKGGLGHVLSGLILVLVSLLIWLLQPGLVLTLCTCSLTLLWLVGKEALRNWLYMPLGEVKIDRSSVEKRSRHPIEWVSGFLLLLIDALTVTSYTYYLQWMLPLAFVLALVCIVLGVNEHLQFRALMEELQTRQQAALWKRYVSSSSPMHQHLSESQNSRNLFLVLLACALSAYSLTHPLLAASLGAGTILLVVLRERLALQVRFAPVYTGYTTRGHHAQQY